MSRGGRETRPRVRRTPELTALTLGLHAEGLTPTQIAGRVGAHPSTVLGWLRDRGLEPHGAAWRWTPGRLAVLRDGWGRRTPEELAGILGCPADSVRRQASRLGLLRRPARAALVRAVSDPGGSDAASPAGESHLALAHLIAAHGPGDLPRLGRLSGLGPSELSGLLRHRWFEREADGWHLSQEAFTKVREG